MHGECKTPRGKLVAVDVAVENSRFQSLRLSGDFFLHPESRTNEVLRAIESALIGLPVSLNDAGLAAHISAAIPFGVELIGSSTEAMALAIRRAISGDPDAGHVFDSTRVGSLDAETLDRVATNWSNLPWRLIPETPRSPALNVALDEVLTDHLAKGLTPPTLRFWRWSSPAVIVGRCQSITNEVDREAAKDAGITIVRRMTGGGAMFLQPHGAITYSLTFPESAVSGLSIRHSYEACEAWLIRGLRDLGVDAHHVPINDIACSAGKIGGAAQARRGAVVLHHTTLAYDMDPGEMVRVLRIGREKLKDKAVTSAQKRVSPLVSQTGRSREEIVSSLFASFQSRYGGTVFDVSAQELSAAEELVKTKYASTEWTDQFE